MCKTSNDLDSFYALYIHSREAAAILALGVVKSPQMPDWIQPTHWQHAETQSLCPAEGVLHVNNSTVK